MNWSHIMIHHSLTKDSKTVSWGAIRKYHTEVRRWDDIGYHYGIELVGDYHETFIGRTLQETGAHCYQKGMNRKAIGICLVGNFDRQLPPEGQLAQAARLVKSLMEELTIPVENVVVHRDYATYKSCPGKLFDMGKFRARLT